MTTQPEDRKIVVSRPEWARGESNTYLRSSDTGRMCCLGFAMNQVDGYSLESISDYKAPEDATAYSCRDSFLCRKEESRDDSGAPIFVYKNKHLAELAMILNDSYTIDDDERESELQKLFEDHGYKMEFID